LHEGRPIPAFLLFAARNGATDAEGEIEALRAGLADRDQPGAAAPSQAVSACGRGCFDTVAHRGQPFALPRAAARASSPSHRHLVAAVAGPDDLAVDVPASLASLDPVPWSDA
jgi:hypothetical protein